MALDGKFIDWDGFFLCENIIPKRLFYARIYIYLIRPEICCGSGLGQDR